MADFRSVNVLGTCRLSPFLMKQEMPEDVLGDVGGTPTAIPTPVSDGGVMCLQTDNLVTAARRNWKTAFRGATEMGAVINVGFDIRAPSAAFYIPSISSFTFEFGATDFSQLGDDTGQDFTGGDPHREIATFVHTPVAIGTSIQRLGDENPAQNVYLVLTLKMEWHGGRWWNQSVDTGDLVTCGFSMKLTGQIFPEPGYSWEEAAALRETTTTWISNWKVSEVGDLEAWGLNTIPLGGPAEVAAFNTLVGEAQCYFVFGNGSPEGPIPLRGYDFIDFDPPVSEIVINSCEIRFPTVLGSIPPL